jgi:hypothetical protein
MHLREAYSRTAPARRREFEPSSRRNVDLGPDLRHGLNPSAEEAVLVEFRWERYRHLTTRSAGCARRCRACRAVPCTAVCGAATSAGCLGTWLAPGALRRGALQLRGRRCQRAAHGQGQGPPARRRRPRSRSVTYVELRTRATLRDGAAVLLGTQGALPYGPHALNTTASPSPTRRATGPAAHLRG